jgi:hypothetical protein
VSIAAGEGAASVDPTVTLRDCSTARRGSDNTFDT